MSNFGNFIFIVSGLFISLALVVLLVFLSLIFVVTLSLFLFSRLIFHYEAPQQFLFHWIFPAHPLFPLEFLHLTSKLSALFSLTAVFSTIALRCSLHGQYLAAK